MFPPYKYIITRILRNVNKNIRKIRKNSRDFHTTKLNLPTGALDSRSSRDLLLSLKAANEKGKATILMVTHDAYTASYAKQVYFLSDGQIQCRLNNKEDRKLFYDEILKLLASMGGERE